MFMLLNKTMVRRTDIFIRPKKVSIFLGAHQIMSYFESELLSCKFDEFHIKPSSIFFFCILLYMNFTKLEYIKKYNLIQVMQYSAEETRTREKFL